MSHDPANLLDNTTTICVALISQGRLEPGGIAPTISAVYAALDASANQIAAAPAEAAAETPEPAVSVRKSLASKDHIISLIDGKPYKTLRRHLAGHGLTPAQYRERYGLKDDYPMVAESYSEARRAMAKKIGLGRKPGQRAG